VRVLPRPGTHASSAASASSRIEFAVCGYPVRWGSAAATSNPGCQPEIAGDEHLDGEIFYTLREAEIVIENWRRHYNTVRPHASIG
jgi:hypothetical protein